MSWWIDRGGTNRKKNQGEENGEPIIIIIVLLHANYAVKTMHLKNKRNNILRRGVCFV
jgi:hypothetical protein